LLPFFAFVTRIFLAYVPVGKLSTPNFHKFGNYFGRASWLFL